MASKESEGGKVPSLLDLLELCEIPGKFSDYLIDEHIGSTEELLQLFHRDQEDFDWVMDRVGIQGTAKNALVEHLGRFAVPKPQPAPKVPAAGSGDESSNSRVHSLLSFEDDVGMHAGAAREMRR